jgi:hypothetical protein
MWGGIVYIGAIMAAGTLLVLDASLPGGFIEGTGDIRYAQTMAFTTLVFFSAFTVFNARSDSQSAFVGLFSNGWLWAAVALALALQVAVVLHAVSTAGVLDGEPGRGGLAALRGGGQLGAVAPRGEQGHRATEGRPRDGTRRPRLDPSRVSRTFRQRAQNHTVAMARSGPIPRPRPTRARRRALIDSGRWMPSCLREASSALTGLSHATVDARGMPA